MRVLINNRNRLTTTREMTVWLMHAGHEVVILDNDSTYGPLLIWYSMCDAMGVRVVISNNNWGPRAAWDCPEFKQFIPDNEFYAVTDSDLELKECPHDLLNVLSTGLMRFPEICKCGVSLRIDDLPDGFPHKQAVINHEQQYSKNELDYEFWSADIETTLAVYRSWPCVYGPSARAKAPYMARHIPWYLTPETITDEERYYIQHIPEEFQGPTWSKMAAEYEFVGTR